MKVKVTSSDEKSNSKECESSKTTADSTCEAGNTTDGVTSDSQPQSSEEAVHPDTNEVKPDTQSEALPSGEAVSFKLVYNKTKYDIEFPFDGTIKQLKEHLSSIINVLPAMQKVMIKGLAKDEKTLRELGVTRGAKVMVVGSKLDDVVSVNTPKSDSASSEKPSTTTSTKEPLSRQKLHRKILDKGLPDDVMPGIKNSKDVLPSYPLSGMVNKHGGKVRLTFKLELDQIWIGTKERTEKINMNHIRQVVSEAIEGYEQYHIMGLQLGPTEASRYWIYWVPAQYVDAIRDTVLGKW
ncbi:ubiquitin domain-containing protein UBFD1 isoform X2 [Cherax quadricarinatus]|uniref:ubiquitin domain-containing protein UBFD1 isoform X2 n=1 Tax=Cherax quadricarinatus TaxID=27406 RepID=UPI0023780AFE|nr:ubiquitin domain-containing protein UBFD1-like isoform X2 [Cherax quadricarinatus]